MLKNPAVYSTKCIPTARAKWRVLSNYKHDVCNCPITAHSRPQRPRSFWSAPRIATSGQVGSPRFTDFPSLCACSESSLTNLIGSDLNLLYSQSHSKPECRWSGPEVAILGADQKERGLWGRE